MRTFKLSDHGLETVKDVCERKGWSASSVQGWITLGLLAAVRVGGGRGTLLLRTADVDTFTPVVEEGGIGRPIKPRPAPRVPRKGRARTRN